MFFEEGVKKWNLHRYVGGQTSSMRVMELVEASRKVKNCHDTEVSRHQASYYRLAYRKTDGAIVLKGHVLCELFFTLKDHTRLHN